MSHILSFLAARDFQAIISALGSILRLEKKIWMIVYLISMYKPEHLISKKIIHVLSKIMYSISPTYFQNVTAF